MTRDLRFLPRVQTRIDVGHRVTGAILQARDFLARVDALILASECSQLVDLGFKIRDGLFEIEIILHQLRPVTKTRYTFNLGNMALFPARNRMISRFIAVYGTFCKGVMLRDQLTEPLIEHMRVDLSGGNVGMAEQFLHRAKVGAVGQKMACKGVPQHVRRDEAGGDSDRKSVV